LGCRFEQNQSKFFSEIIDYLNQEIKPKLESGILKIKDNYLKIPEKHWFLADGIASDLFIV
jgi:oxygen-independent coproporphyrinogen-3 oxidase